MTQYEIAIFVDRHLRAATRGADGWPLAWVGGIARVSGVSHYLDLAERLGSNPRYELQAWLDRDRCDQARAMEIAAAAERAFAAANPSVPEPLVILPYPTVRLEMALVIVKDHFETWSIRERDRMRRDGEAWMSLGSIDRVTHWTPERDRIRVEMYAESSADEGEAEKLGKEWLAHLLSEQPELAQIVEIHGASH